MTQGTSIDRTVGQRIATAREESGFTQRGLAARLGWPHGTLANYESGRRRLPLAHLAHIAHTLGRSPASFLVDAHETALVIDRMDGDAELVRQVAYFLTTLDEPLPDAP